MGYYSKFLNSSMDETEVEGLKRNKNEELRNVKITKELYFKKARPFKTDTILLKNQF